jgi:hypothetical protein
VFYVRENSQTVRSANESIANESLPSSPSITHLSVNYFPQSQTNSMPGFSKRVNFIPSHRKAHSLGTNVLSSMTSTHSSTTPSNILHNKTRCLIDDSLMNEDPVIICDSMPSFEIIYDDEEVDVEVETEEQKPLNRYIEFNPSVIKDKILFQGLVKRKTIMKDGKKPSVSYLRFCPLVRTFSLTYFLH